MANSFDLSVNVRNANPSANIDYYYGTYESKAQACALVPRAVRMKGKTVGIIENGSVVEYWWRSGIEDDDLEVKFGINTIINNNYNKIYTNLGNDTSVTITSNEHKKGLNPIVMCFVNGNVALFDISNSNGNITITWVEGDLSNSDTLNVVIISSDYMTEFNDDDEMSISLESAECGSNPIIQCWLNGELSYANVSIDNGILNISVSNDFDGVLKVLLAKNPYIEEYLNEEETTSYTISKNTHNKGENPFVQCWLGNELALFDIENNGGDITIIWANPNDVSAVNPLRILITDEPQSTTTYNINDLVVIGEKNVGDGGITTTKEVGGIRKDLFINKNTLLNELLRNMLAPTLNPTIVEPSATLTTNTNTYLYEVGSSMNITFSITFNQGSITPQYTSESPYRSGGALSYQINDNAKQYVNVALIRVCLFDSYGNGIEGFADYKGRVEYDRGVQPKNSNNENYLTPLSAGSVETNEISFEFVYPLYANSNDIQTIQKQPLVSKSRKYVEIEFPPQDETNRYTFEVPSTWTINYIFMYNSVSQSYDENNNKLSDFIHETINKYGVSYIQYKNKGTIKSGKNKYKIIWQ